MVTPVAPRFAPVALTIPLKLPVPLTSKGKLGLAVVLTLIPVKPEVMTEGLWGFTSIVTALAEPPPKANILLDVPAVFAA